MRLLDTSTQTLVEFANPPDEYAILSHTWDNEEVTFEDITGDKKYWKDGWNKIANCCKLAKEDGWQYVWIDTCCIDKSSSADLSEAINSMFVWYASASICYAYLEDVSGSDSPSALLEDEVVRSRWFTRGWTLQELIAPIFLVFLNQSWQIIGTRTSLASAIEESTKIGRRDLESWKDRSIATKMSWAAHRETTRVEDQAYCLMGLFGINMPLLYGEGEHAFLRLQHEIIRASDDESIFAWKDTTLLHFPENADVGGLLAPSPRCFADAAGIVPYRLATPANADLEYRMTNKGLSINLLIYKHDNVAPLGILNCGRPDTGSKLAIDLKEQDDGTFVRTNLYEMKETHRHRLSKNSIQARRVYIREPDNQLRKDKSLKSSFPFFRNNTAEWEMSFPFEYVSPHGLPLYDTFAVDSKKAPRSNVFNANNFKPVFPAAPAPQLPLLLSEENRHLHALMEEPRTPHMTLLYNVPSKWGPLIWEVVLIRCRHNSSLCMILAVRRMGGTIKLALWRHNPAHGIRETMRELQRHSSWAEEASLTVLQNAEKSAHVKALRKELVRARLEVVPNFMPVGQGVRSVIVDLSSKYDEEISDIRASERPNHGDSAIQPFDEVQRPVPDDPKTSQKSNDNASAWRRDPILVEWEGGCHLVASKT